MTKEIRSSKSEFVIRILDFVISAAMSTFRLTLASLLYHWRSNLAVACGAAAGTAVLTGALLVGDSMRGSLRSLTLDRLGKIDEALVMDHFFRTALADETSQAAAPVILLQASLENPDAQSPRRAGRDQPDRLQRPFLAAWAPAGRDERHVRAKSCSTSPPPIGSESA